MSVIVLADRLVSSDREITDGWIRFEGDRIDAIGSGAPPTGTEVVHVPGAMLAPGFVDIHCHGGGGAAFDDGADAIAAGLAVHRAHGTTRSVLSLVTGTMEAMTARARIAARCAAADPTIAGIHLEGPFLDPDHRGAHAADLLRPPTAELVDQVIDACEGRLVQVTIAAELPGGAEAIRRFVDAGVRVALGHTDADHDAARRAFDDGASILTHTFNAMPGLHHRAPGPVAAALADDRVTLEVIADGVHVHPSMIALLFDQAPGRVALVTDAMSATGCDDGDYVLGDLDVRVSGGVPRLVDSGAIAGSTLTMDEAVRFAALEVGVPLADAVAAATCVPARAIGLEAAGDLRVGGLADATLLDAAFRPLAVWAAGSRVR